MMSASSMAMPETMMGTHASATSTTAQYPHTKAMLKATTTVHAETTLRPMVSPESACTMFTCTPARKRLQPAHTLPCCRHTTLLRCRLVG